MDAETGTTSIAGGHAVTGEATVISAMGTGRAAAGIDRFVREKHGL